MVASAENTCHPENILKSLLCFARVSEHQLVMTLISIFLGCVWRVQCFCLPLQSPAHWCIRPLKNLSQWATLLLVISLHIAFGFLSEKPKHKHLHIMNHMLKRNTFEAFSCSFLRKPRSFTFFKTVFRGTRILQEFTRIVGHTHLKARA